MDAFLHDLRIGLRTLMRRPAFTTVAVGTLALGIGSTTAIFSVVDGVLLRPLPYEDPGALVTLWETPGPGASERSEVSWVAFEEWKDASSFAALAAHRAETATLTGLGEPDVLAGARITADFFRVFGVPPVLGRGPAPDEAVEGGPAVVVVSHAFWESRLARDPDVLSRSLELDGVAHQVVGVAPPGFGFPGEARVWRPVQNRAGCGRECRYLHVVGRLADDATPTRARLEMSTLVARSARENPGTSPGGVVVVPLHDVLVGEIRPGLLAVLGAVVLVLLIACANVANLLLARGAGRTGEVAVRRAMGGDRGRIVRQLLAETLVLAALAGGVGFLMAVWGLDLIRASAPADLPRMSEVGMDGRVAAFAGGLVLVTALLFGSGPAVHLSRAPVAAGLGEGGGGARGGTARGWGRTALLVAEVALSLVLLSGAGLLFRSAREMERLDPGFDPGAVLAFGVSLPPSRYPGARERERFFRTLEERLLLYPRVEAVGSARGSPLEGADERRSFRPADEPPPAPGEEFSALVRLATPGYFRTLRVPLLEGRLFDDRDAPDDPRVGVVSRTVARRTWPGEEAVGKLIVLASAERPDSLVRVVGVVGDTRSPSLTDDPPGEIYLPFQQETAARLTVHVRALPGTGGTEGLDAVARAQLRALDPDLPALRMETLEERVLRATARSRFYLTLMSLFALVAVSLAAVGLYGVVAYLVSRRTREIGIRMTLGADDGHVVRLLLREGFGPALLGIVVGLGATVVGTRALEGLLFRVEPADPGTVAAVTGLVLAVVLAASLVPAKRATRIPPGEVVRADGARRPRGG